VHKRELGAVVDRKRDSLPCFANAWRHTQYNELSWVLNCDLEGRGNGLLRVCQRYLEGPLWSRELMVNLLLC
jgi:hypothetical protein